METYSAPRDFRRYEGSYGHRFTQALREYEYPAKSGRGSAEKNLPSAARRRTSRLRLLQSSSASSSRGIASDHNRLPKISCSFL
jgi:hypothetical protein